MDSYQNSTINTVGFSLLPSELLGYIIYKLPLPDVFRIKSINTNVSSIISDRDFIRGYNYKWSSSSWFYIYKKRGQRNSTLHGFTNKCDRWFKIPIMELLDSILPSKEDAYFLTASGNFFLFAINATQEVISVNPMRWTVKKIPPCPMGPRDTSTWRRSGMKLLSGPLGSDNFHFLFADYFENCPTLFDYCSETNIWQTTEAKKQVVNIPSIYESTCDDHIFLSVSNDRNGSVLIFLPSQGDEPLVIQPKQSEGAEEERFVVGFSSGRGPDRLHVYGDGNMIIVRSDKYSNMNMTAKMLKSIELWGVGSNGASWEHISKVPNVLIERIKKPYGVIMGCLAATPEFIRIVLMSNFEGIWDFIWVSYDTKEEKWSWIPLPDCRMKGINMAGISFSCGLTLT